ncbi:urea carboxylase-associated family protein [Galbibacter pacificus]|uniref:Urea carboxylase-associated family protein n=1 Tax=Galbibacter pacificus TaxID=2996052 RepID=A0ABT6FPP9_9FLAO|nr:urea carboxylase-associated family protein [Galbibacter pacificus]MDG3582281.1 urea carboxylase-associated family protein [Galbibacter pacificus]MDG3585243.1 urea carboxylase-associated family protein [Galbibacter pacificus]
MIYTISKLCGTAFTLKKGQYLKVINPEGAQVSDMILVNPHDIKEKISSGKTLDFEESILISTNNFLWSNRSNKMMQIIEDTNDRNDFLLAPCDSSTFAHFYDMHDPHPSCLDNLARHLKKYGIMHDEIPTAFNIFMNVAFDSMGTIRVLPPTAVAGDYVLFKAEMDLLVALTACSAKDSNGGCFKSIQYEIINPVDH